MESNNMIYIGKPYIIRNDDVARLCSVIKSPGHEDYEMWYEVDVSYENYLCEERVDAFVVTLLYYAMEHELNIFSETQMSERLFYTLTQYIIPGISKHIDRYKKIEINIPVSSKPIENIGAVATGISCGVDSFYTIMQHINRAEKSYNLTHVCFFNAGSNGNYGGKEARILFHKRIEMVSNASKILELPLIAVDTNANEFLLEMHCGTETTRTLAIPLALQKLFSTYYFSSGYPYDAFCFTVDDSAHYDILVVNNLSTENMTFFSSGGEVTRQEKLRYISEFDVVRNHLNVCVMDGINCSKCEKCRRTMSGLYAIGMLDHYSGVFDVDNFHRNKNEYLGFVFANRYKHDWDEIYFELKKKGEMGIIQVCYGILIRLYRAIRKIASR